MSTRISNLIRTNKYLRLFLLPGILVVRLAEYLKYQNGPYSQMIKELRGKFADKKCIIIGNGPSLSTADLDKIDDRFISIATNRIFDMYPFSHWRPTIYMIMDRSNIRSIGKELKEPPQSEVLIVGDRKVANQWKEYKAIYAMSDWKRKANLHNQINKSFSDDVSCYFSQSSSTTINEIELAIYMGIKEIYLLGMDHSFPIEIDLKGNVHKYVDRENHFKQSKDKSIYYSNKEALTINYQNIKKFAENKGVHIYNSTRGGQLEVFPRVDFDDVVKK